MTNRVSTTPPRDSLSTGDSSRRYATRLLWCDEFRGFHPRLPSRGRYATRRRSSPYPKALGHLSRGGIRKNNRPPGAFRTACWLAAFPTARRAVLRECHLYSRTSPAAVFTVTWFSPE